MGKEGKVECPGCCFLMCTGDPVSMDLDRQREWDEAVRLHFYNDEQELLLHGNSNYRLCLDVSTHFT